MKQGEWGHFAERCAAYQPTKAGLVLASFGGAAVTILVGFAFCGWTTASTSRANAASISLVDVSRLASAICVERFEALVDYPARILHFRSISDVYERRKYIEEGGWAKMPGSIGTSGAAASCSATLAS